MSETVKLIVEIDERLYERIKYYEPNGNTMVATALHSIANGTPLDSVKAEIENKYREVEFMDEFSSGYNYAIGDVLEALCNIGKAESEE